MVKETVYCDVCMIEKKEGNGWWQICKCHQTDVCGGVLHDKPMALVIRPYEADDENGRHDRAACGTSCLMRLVNNYVMNIQEQGVHR